MCLWFASGELRHVASLANTVGQRELDLRVKEHLDSSTLNIFSLDGLDLQNMDSVSLGTMASTHITVGLSDSSGNRNIAVLTVHVVVAGSRVVFEPDSEVLHGAGIFSENLKNLVGKGEKSNTTGWDYNDPDNGGFEYHSGFQQETGPGLKFIQG